MKYKSVRFLSLARVLFVGLVAVMLQTTYVLAKNADYKYNFSGYDAQHGRSSHLSFNILPDGTIKGVQKISTVCQSQVHLSGGKIFFTGHLSGSYPQAVGRFHGKSHFCGNGSANISGTIKIGYHPQFGVFTQLFGASEGEEYYHHTSSNPFY